MGRKSRYETYVLPHLAEIREWYKTLTERDIAKRLGVSEGTFYKYKTEHKELEAVLRDGRQELVSELKKSLKKKAIGFEYTETKKTIREIAGKKVITIEEYKRYSPPDTGAIHLLLKNLDETWRNDDAETMALKREKIELEKQKAEDERW